MPQKSLYLNLIQSNIDEYGYHITVVMSKLDPRYAYTIGLTNLFGFELIFAGGIYYLKDDLFQVFDAVVKALKKGDQKATVEFLGTFRIAQVDSSWSELMMLGVYDHYNTSTITAFQIIPDSDHYTLDIPRMSNKLVISEEPVWQWLVRKWDYPVPENSTVVTDLKALLGAAITEIVRCGDDEWEMFAGAGPDVQKEDARVVSLASIIGMDKTLLPAISLNIGEGLWRDTNNSDWNSWG